VPIGSNEGDVLLREGPDTAYARVRSALASVGKVTEEDETERFLRGSARYGLQKVRLKINVDGDQGGSVVRVRAQGDDLWGKAARTVVRRLSEALEGG
jgi:hypothetical protein